jgi:hypothetical protein
MTDYVVLVSATCIAKTTVVIKGARSAEEAELAAEREVKAKWRELGWEHGDDLADFDADESLEIAASSEAPHA